MRSQSDIDSQVESANRVPAGFADSEEARILLDAVGARIIADGLPLIEEPRRRRFALPVARRSVILGAAVAGLAVSVAAAATVFLNTTTVGTGRPGYCQTAINATTDVPFPSGDQAARNWALLLSAVPKQGATLSQLCAGNNVGSAGPNPVTGGPAPEVIGVINVKATFVMVAFCAWTDQWLTAERDGDAAAASSAANEIAGARQWPSTQTVDASSETLDWLPAAQQWVQAGDVSSVASMFTYSPTAQIPADECVLYTPPAGSDNGTVNPE